MSTAQPHVSRPSFTADQYQAYYAKYIREFAFNFHMSYKEAELHLHDVYPDGRFDLSTLYFNPMCRCKAMCVCMGKYCGRWHECACQPGDPCTCNPNPGCTCYCECKPVCTCDRFRERRNRQWHPPRRNLQEARNGADPYPTVRTTLGPIPPRNYWMYSSHCF